MAHAYAAAPALLALPSGADAGSLALENYVPPAMPGGATAVVLPPEGVTCFADVTVTTTGLVNAVAPPSANAPCAEPWWSTVSGAAAQWRFDPLRVQRQAEEAVVRVEVRFAPPASGVMGAGPVQTRLASARATVAAPVTAPGGPRVVPFTDLRLVHRVIASYPDAAWFQGVHEGKCLVHVTVDEHGVPTRVEPRDCAQVFAAPTVDAVMQWRFDPYRPVVESEKVSRSSYGDPEPVQFDLQVLYDASKE